MKKLLFLFATYFLTIRLVFAVEIKVNSTFYFENYDDPKPEIEDCTDVNSSSASGGNAMVSPGQMFIKKSICQTQKNSSNEKVPTDKKAVYLAHEKANNDYLSDCVFIKDLVKKEEGTITSIARCNINDAVLNKEFLKRSAAGQTSAGEGSNIVYFIAMRKADTGMIKNDDVVFDSKRTDKAASETVSIQDDEEGERTISSKSSTIEKGKVTGGTRVITSDKVSYKALDTVDPAVVEDGFNDILSRYHFETTDYGFAECDESDNAPDYEEMTEEFVDSNKLKKKTLKNAITFVKDCGFKYFVVGSITIDSKSSVNNNVQVNASMSTRVYLLAEKTKNVASTSNQKIGEGKNEIEATRQAIKNLTNETAEIIAAKLNAKGIN
jgi:hypothetical protein